jgi:hypothetical protein
MPVILPPKLEKEDANETKAQVRQRQRWDAPTIVEFVMKKKVPFLVKHGVAAVWEGTYRYIKHTPRGDIRTSKRIKVHTRSVTRTRQGFIDAFNIIAESFIDYGYLSNVTFSLTSKGQQRNKIHLREVDARRRTSLFTGIFERYFKSEIEAYKLNNK